MSKDRFHSARCFLSCVGIYNTEAGSDLGSMGDRSCHLHFPCVYTEDQTKCFYQKATRLDRCIFVIHNVYYDSHLSRLAYLKGPSIRHGTYLCFYPSYRLNLTPNSVWTGRKVNTEFDTRSVLSLHPSMLKVSLRCGQAPAGYYLSTTHSRKDQSGQGTFETRTGVRTRGGDEPKSAFAPLSYISRADHSSFTVAILTFCTRPGRL